MNVFLDSSALAKRYVEEPGSDRLQEVLASASALGLCVLCVTEIVSALRRRLREGGMSQAAYGAAKEALLADLEDASLVNLTDEVVAGAVEILERWPLRSSDSLHLAAASVWAADLFVSADERQCAAARGCGLQVEELGGG